MAGMGVGTMNVDKGVTFILFSRDIRFVKNHD